MPTPPKRRWRISRRGFLIGAGALGGGLALGVAFGLPALQLAIADALEQGGGPPAAVAADPLLWFEVTPDGAVILGMPKVEMGQGVHTALAQVAAEELEIPWAQIAVVQAGSLGPNAGVSSTSGSTSVSSLFTPLRQAAATLREILRLEASARLGVPPGGLVAAQGAFVDRTNPASRITYGQLVQGRANAWAVPEEPPPLKPISEFAVIGQPLPRLDLPAKIRGQAAYGYDVRVEGMLYGAVARPPTIGARLRRAAPGTAAQRPGVVAVLAEVDFAGVVASSRSLAYQALSDLELEWDEPEPLQQEQIDAWVTASPGAGTVIQRAGDAPAALRNVQTISAAYRTPMAAHAHLEPQAAMVDVRPDRVVARVSTQFPANVADAIAQAIGRDAKTVDVTPTYLGGGLGSKGIVQAAVEAARLSSAAGRPVHVGWTRTEDFRYGYLRPPTHSLLTAALGPDGTVQAITHQQASGDVLFAVFPAPLRLLFGADIGAWRGARLSYAIPNIEVRAQRVELPIATGPWRGLGLLANVFAVESFIDELAHAAGADPLAFRLAHLGDAPNDRRLRAVLEAVARRAGWGAAAPPAGRAWGLACCLDAGTAAAIIAEVSVDGGSIRAHRVWTAVDPGLVINPDGAAAQIEGNITMGLSSTLIERITVRDGQIAAGNFNDYPLLTMRDTPEIDVQLLQGGDTPNGLGEPPMGPIAAAVANAVFALSGLRIRELPLRV